MVLVQVSVFTVFAVAILIGTVDCALAHDWWIPRGSFTIPSGGIILHPFKIVTFL